MRELTEWYPGDVKPVRIGKYLRRYGGEMDALCEWDGKQWLFHAGIPSLFQNLPGRGLTAPAGDGEGAE